MVVALKGIDLVVGKEEFIYLVGPSGSGKSTLLNLLYRAEIPASNGDVYIDNIRINGLPEKEISKTKYWGCFPGF